VARLARRSSTCATPTSGTTGTSRDGVSAARRSSPSTSRTASPRSPSRPARSCSRSRRRSTRRRARSSGRRRGCRTAGPVPLRRGGRREGGHVGRADDPAGDHARARPVRRRGAPVELKAPAALPGGRQPQDRLQARPARARQARGARADRRPDRERSRTASTWGRRRHDAAKRAFTKASRELKEAQEVAAAA
jgi:hypothetical protein